MALISSIKDFSFSRLYSKFNRKATQVGLDLCGTKKRPVLTISTPKTLSGIEWVGKNLSSAENRLILGASALMIQPFIDASNKRVDSETRRISICRTIAKIIAGTITGYSIRKGCIASINAFTKLPEEVMPMMKFKKLRTFLTPSLNFTAEELKQYKNALGTLIALGVMLFTNFLIDAPLTRFLTNTFAKKKGAVDGKS